MAVRRSTAGGGKRRSGRTPGVQAYAIPGGMGVNQLERPPKQRLARLCSVPHRCTRWVGQRYHVDRLCVADDSMTASNHVGEPVTVQ